MGKNTNFKLIKTDPITDIIDVLMKRFEEDRKRFKENGNMCLQCGKNPGDLSSKIDMFRCKECNQRSEEIIKKLHGG